MTDFLFRVAEKAIDLLYAAQSWIVLRSSSVPSRPGAFVPMAYVEVDPAEVIRRKAHAYAQDTRPN